MICWFRNMHPFVFIIGIVLCPQCTPISWTHFLSNPVQTKHARKPYQRTTQKWKVTFLIRKYDYMLSSFPPNNYMVIGRKLWHITSHWSPQSGMSCSQCQAYTLPLFTIACLTMPPSSISHVLRLSPQCCISAWSCSIMLTMDWFKAYS